MLSYAINAEDHCRQVESFLHNLLPLATRGYLQKLIKNGHASVNGRDCSAEQLLKNRDTLTLKESSRTAALLRAERPVVDILYEDDMLLVVNKEPGRSVHNTAEDAGSDLVLHCEEYLERRGTPCKLRPVNRLDRGTSGAIILAKSPTAAGIMGRFIREEGLAKIYLAAVMGVVDSKGEIDLPLEGKDSLTRYQRIFQGGYDAVVAVYPVTGRTHQIRKHFSSYGHPVVGDRRYGGLSVKGLGGHALHAFAVGFRHPATGQSITVYAPLPPGLTSLLRQIAAGNFATLLQDLTALKFDSGFYEAENAL
jgi:23S rRNA pseudouridine955/2504/2580 synthase